MSVSNRDRAGLSGSLRAEIARIPLVDAHDHLPSEDDWLATSPALSPAFQREPDFSSLLGYAYWDLVSAGMSKDALAPGMSGPDKWAIVRPFWDYVRYMGTGVLCRRALSLFCGVDDLSESALPVIEEKVRGLRQPGVYRRLFKEQFNFAVCLNTQISGPVTETSASDLFAPLLYVSDFALAQKRSDVAYVEKTSGQSVYSLATYLRALDIILEQAVRDGAVGIKWHRLAYLRDMHYPMADPRDAERCLERILRMPARGGVASETAVGFDEMIPFQNLVVHHLTQGALELDLPVQIHTGMLGGSFGAQISYTNPTPLVNLFLQYPRVRFDLLHAGYPYAAETASLVKLFPNVYLNTAWFEVLSPRAARQYIQEWLSSLPINKIFAFGGDHKNVLLTCAYAEMARDNLADTLAEEVSEARMSEQQALKIANRLLRENAWEFFKLEERWANRQQRQPRTTDWPARAGQHKADLRG